MAHDKVYAVCENKCFVETKTKEQIENEIGVVSNTITDMFKVITVPADSEETEVELGTDLPFMTEVINLKSSSITVKFTKPEEEESVALKFGYIKSTAALTEVSQTVTTSYSLTLETGRRMIIYGNVHA